MSTCIHTAKKRALELSVESFRVVRSEIETFHKSALRHVEPVVRSSLPSLESKPTTNHQWSEE